MLTGAGERPFAPAPISRAAANPASITGPRAAPNGFGGLAFRRSLDVPVIARVNGFALGGGFEMVLGCDIVIAAETAKFGLPEARVGRMPLDGGMVLLQRKIPFNRAMAVLMTGRRFQRGGDVRLASSTRSRPRPGSTMRWRAGWPTSLACAPLSLARSSKR